VTDACATVEALRAQGLSETTTIPALRDAFLQAKTACDRSRSLLANLSLQRDGTNVFGGDACKAEASARAMNLPAATLAALAAKCAAQRAAKPFVAGSGTSSAIASAPVVIPVGSTPDPIAAPSSGPSPVLIGAIALGVGVVGLLAFRSMKRKKR